MAQKAFGETREGEANTAKLKWRTGTAAAPAATTTTTTTDDATNAVRHGYGHEL